MSLYVSKKDKYIANVDVKKSIGQKILSIQFVKFTSFIEEFKTAVKSKPENEFFAFDTLW